MCRIEKLIFPMRICSFIFIILLNVGSILGEQLRFYHPFVYHWSAPPAVPWIQAVPNLVAVARGDHVTRPPWFRSLTLFLSNQLAVTSFAKARQYGKGKHCVP